MNEAEPTIVPGLFSITMDIPVDLEAVPWNAPETHPAAGIRSALADTAPTGLSWAIGSEVRLLRFDCYHCDP